MNKKGGVYALIDDRRRTSEEGRGRLGHYLNTTFLLGLFRNQGRHASRDSGLVGAAWITVKSEIRAQMLMITRMFQVL